MQQQTYSISPLGDSALTIDFGNVIDESVNRKVLALSQAFKTASLFGIRDVVPAYSSITIHYDIVSTMQHSIEKSAFTIIKEKLESLLLKQDESSYEQTRNLKIPVCYAERYALDLNDIALLTKLTVEEVVQLHTSRKYRVYMVGFLPGFAYMGEVDESIAVPRKSEPRLQIEEGYVGIAGKQTGIYPLTSPGGWQIIGRTPVKLFDRNKEHPVLFAPGDEVEFFSITENEFYNY